MKLALDGVGNAGSRLANRIVATEISSGRNLTNGNTLLINTSPPEFDTTEHVPSDRRLVIGDVNRGLDGEGAVEGRQQPPTGEMQFGRVNPG